MIEQYGRVIEPGLQQGQDTRASGLSSPYSDRFGLSLAGDKTLAKLGTLSSGDTTLITVPRGQTFVTSNVWLYLINTASDVTVKMKHTLESDSGVSDDDIFWGKLLTAANPWAVLQVQKVLESESILTINVDVADVVNVNVDGIIIETQ